MADFYSSDISKNLRKLRQLKPELFKSFIDFDQAVFKDGALNSKTKQLMAVTAAHVTQCPWCIDVHTKAAMEHGATEEELAEAVFVAMAMRAGAAFSHSTITLDAAASHNH
ncbi:MAG: carboxymuconolactone decarboxylase family protein [Candidatus Binataceae bacterium]